MIHRRKQLGGGGDERSSEESAGQKSDHLKRIFQMIAHRKKVPVMRAIIYPPNCFRWSIIGTKCRSEERSYLRQIDSESDEPSSDRQNDVHRWAYLDWCASQYVTVTTVTATYVADWNHGEGCLRTWLAPGWHTYVGDRHQKRKFIAGEGSSPLEHSTNVVHSTVENWNYKTMQMQMQLYYWYFTKVGIKQPIPIIWHYYEISIKYS